MGNHRKSAGLAQVSSKINELRKAKGLLFQKAFEEKGLSARIQKYFPKFRDRIFGPATTLFALLSQMLSADRSCTETVARVNIERIAQGKDPISPHNGGFVKARERMPEEFIHELMTDTAETIEENVPEEWLWKSRHVKFTDGSTLTMADTPENQAEYAQADSQKEGVGFPITRLIAVFSLASGCVMDVANGPYRGKGTGEHALLRQLLHCFQAGDVVVGDAYFSAYFLIAVFQAMNVDCVFASDGKRRIDFRAGERLRKKDHIVAWQKPQKPSWMDQQTYDQMPAFLRIRECQVTLDRPGFRSTSINLVSTLCDSQYASGEELGWLYRQRWAAELNLRALKTTLKMEHIRAKTPFMVRKEIWATLLAYNLIRKIIGEAAYRYDFLPQELSFKGAVQNLNAFRFLWLVPGASNQITSLDILLELISKMRVANRPGRVEPRAIKKRPRAFPRLQMSRAAARERIMQNCMR